MHRTVLRRAIVCLAAIVVTAIAGPREARAVDVTGTQVPAVVLPGTSGAGLFTFRLTHSGLFPASFVGVTLKNSTQGPGTTAQLDAELPKLHLYRDDGNGTFDPESDALIADSSVSGGRVVFSGFNITLTALFPVTFHVGADIPLAVRDSDVLDLLIADSTSLQFGSAVPVTGSFPIDPNGGLLVNGMSAAQILVYPISSGSAPLDSRDNLVFDFRIFSNGYQVDQLERFRFVNAGTAVEDDDIHEINVYQDGGDESFDHGSGDDIDLGRADWQDPLQAWEIHHHVPLPPEGARFFVGARIRDDATSGSTIAMEILGPGEQGVVVLSANDGPLDAAVSSQGVLTIGNPTGVVAVDALPQGIATVLPGGAPRTILALRMVTTTAQAETLRTISVTNTTTGPGTIAERDAEWAPARVRAIRLAGNQSILPPFPPDGVTFTGGKATITGFNVRLAPNDTVLVIVESAASVVARDSDILDVGLQASADLGFRRAVNVTGVFPLAPFGGYPVDGISRAQVGFEDPGATTILTGSVRNVIATLRLPPNGYQADVLKRLDVVTDGSAIPGVHIEHMEAWVDDGDGVFEVGSDALLGELLFTGKRWQITGLAQAVPTGWIRIFITCDVSTIAFENATVHVTIPTLPDVGIGMASTNDGPIDDTARSPWTQTISSVDRIAMVSNPIESGPVSPDGTGVPLLHFYLVNTYGVAKTLDGITMTNLTVGPGTQDELDSEFATVAFRLDGNGDSELADTVVDPVLATSFFVGGRAVFSGLGLTLPPGGGASVFVSADVAPAHARDSDALQAVIGSAADVVFTDDITASAQWPVTSNAAWTIDGMIASQITSQGAPSTTIGPSEGPALALDVVVPSNGYGSDTLRGITLVNLGTAVDADLAEMRLWIDGGDGKFDGGTIDDATLGPLTSIAGSWTSPFLSTELPPGGLRTFVSITTSAAPTDSATVRLAIPVDGITVESGNDGPRDVSVANDAAQILSTAALLATIEIDPSESVLGNVVDIRMNVRNAGLVAVDSIVPAPLAPTGAGSLLIVDGPTPPMLFLAPGDTRELTWTADAGTVGEVRFSSSVSGVEQGSGLLRQSLTVTSNSHEVFAPASRVDLFPVESMPFSINRGQTDVVPLTLTFSHPDSAGVSSIELRGFRIALENDVGGGIVPADLLSRVVVSEGATQYLEKTSLETSGSSIDLTLTTPLVIEAGGANGGQITLALALDISDSTTVPNFRLSIADSTWFSAEDAITTAPVRDHASRERLSDSVGSRAGGVGCDGARRHRGCGLRAGGEPRAAGCRAPRRGAAESRSGRARFGCASGHVRCAAHR